MRSSESGSGRRVPEALVTRHLSLVFRGPGRLARNEAIDGHLALALDADRVRPLELERVTHAPVGRVVNEYHPGGRFGGDPARDIDGVAPQVVNEFLHADHARHHGPGTDADVDLEPRALHPGLGAHV